MSQENVDLLMARFGAEVEGKAGVSPSTLSAMPSTNLDSFGGPR
jgi:hypothetical protein